MVYPLTPYKSAPGDYRGSTTRLLLAQADRWIERHLTPDSTGVIEVRVARIQDGLYAPLVATVLLMADAFATVLPQALAEGAVYTRKMSASGHTSRLTLVWPTLCLEASCYVPAGTRIKGEPKGAA
jgi:hypothetical protein